MTDYDYAAVAEPTDPSATGSSLSRKPIIKDDRLPWSEPKHRLNKKGGGPNRKKNNKNNKQKKRNGTKQQKQLNKRQGAAAMRTVRRAEAFDNNDDSTTAGQQNLNQLFGLGKPRPLLPPASQLKPFVSVGVCSQKKKSRGKRKTIVCNTVSHFSHTHLRGVVVGVWLEKLGP
jgi:hypothetical protein